MLLASLGRHVRADASLHAGTLAEIEERARSHGPGLHAIALASSLLCAAPLLSWWLSWPQRLW